MSRRTTEQRQPLHRDIRQGRYAAGERLLVAVDLQRAPFLHRQPDQPLLRRHEEQGSEVRDDGSLTIYVQADEPSDPVARAQTGCRAPKGDFSLYVRAYWPKLAVTGRLVDAAGRGTGELGPNGERKMSRTASNLAILAAAAAVGLSSVGTAAATEGVAGRYIPGAYAGPGAGIVPPMPGTYWAISNLYYHGEAGGEVPFGNNTIALGLEADMWATIFAGVYVPELDLPGNWTYAVQGAVPVGWTRATANVGPFEQDGRGHRARRHHDRAAAVRLAQRRHEHVVLGATGDHRADRRMDRKARSPSSASTTGRSARWSASPISSPSRASTFRRNSASTSTPRIPTPTTTAARWRISTSRSPRT